MSLWNDRLDYIRSIPKTMYVNFKYFPFKDALKVPLLVSHRVYLKSLKGELIIEKKISFGIVKIGFGDISIFDKKIQELFGNITKSQKLYLKEKQILVMDLKFLFLIKDISLLEKILLLQLSLRLCAKKKFHLDIIA